MPDLFPLGPDSQRQPGVPAGTITKARWTSTIFPGTERDYWLYVPAGHRAGIPASLMVFQDGNGYVNSEGDLRVPIVFDNLIHRGLMPPTIGVFIDPGTNPQDPHQRSLEYDTLSDRFSRFLLDEFLPVVLRDVSVTTDPEQRAICGMSSGGICSWTVAWHRPDAFRRVLSHVGSFADIRGGHVYPFLIRKTERKPIRILLQAGRNDLDCDWGNWFLANEQMASALKYKGYDYRYEVGDGGHDGKHAGSILPQSLQWLFR